MISDKEPGASPDQRIQRRVERWEPFVGYLKIHNESLPCRMIDISSEGAKVFTEDWQKLFVSTKVTFELNEYGALPSEVVHTQSGFVGLKFLVDDLGRRMLFQWLQITRRTMAKNSQLSKRP